MSDSGFNRIKFKFADLEIVEKFYFRGELYIKFNKPISNVGSYNTIAIKMSPTEAKKFDYKTFKNFRVTMWELIQIFTDEEKISVESFRKKWEEKLNGALKTLQ